MVPLTRHTGLTYATTPQRELQLDLYLPEGVAGAPLVVFIHGGEWRWGNRDRAPVGVLLRAGFALASISYRLSHEASFPAQMEDCKAAIRWLRVNARQFGYDATRIGAWGVSAGGHLVSLLGTTGEVQAVVDFYGPSDLTELGGLAGSPEAELIGGEVHANWEKAVQASPVTYVSADAAPFLIIHGDNDESVPVRQSELLAESLKRAGIAAEFRRLSGAGHGGPEFRTEELQGCIIAFFSKHLRPL